MITRVRCASPCDEVPREQWFDRPQQVNEGCGHNQAVGCLIEHATGDLYSSRTSTYFDEVREKFRECTPGEREELLRVEADGG